MMTVELAGGLGNQMFQAATAYVVAITHGDTCALNFASRPQMQRHGAATYRDNVFKHFPPLPRRWRPSYIYRENGYAYQNIPYHKDMMLRGYFSDEKYIAAHRDKILALFLDEPSIAKLREEYGHILSNSVSLHVRRGDYLGLPDVYVILGFDYYDNALDYIQSIAEIDNILVFSDDIQWCRDNLSDHRITYIDGQPDYMDMYLMSLCNQNIMANSSFSWWGSYLNTNPGKIVCAPRVWFQHHGPANAEHLYCSNWKLL